MLKATREMKSHCFTDVLGWRRSREATLPLTADSRHKAWIQFQTQRRSARECQDLGHKVHGPWQAACPAALFCSSPKDSNSPFLPGPLFFCRLAIKTNNTPFLLLSTTFSWWTGSAEHTSDNTIWLSLPRVISSSSLLPPSPSHFPSLCLASCSS